MPISIALKSKHVIHFSYFTTCSCVMNYINRTCAKLTDVLDCMSKGMVAFIGPKMCGKSTTLRAAYAKAIEDGNNAFWGDLQYVTREEIPDNVLLFLDNAQLLRRDKPTYGWLLKAIDSALGVCLAFSPPVNGICLNRFPRHVSGRKFYFTPFTSSELCRYLELVNVTYNNGLTIPGVVVSVINGNEYSREASTYVLDCISKALSRENHITVITEFLQILCSAALKGIDSLDVSSKEILLMSGCAYLNESKVHEFLFPSDILLLLLRTQVERHYSLLEQFDIGAAAEYLFFARCLSGGVIATCKGQSCYPITASTKMEATVEIACDNSIKQRAVSDNLIVPINKCTIIHLCQNHFAIDFLILNNRPGVRAKRLYFVQVSLQRYQDRPAEKKFSAVTTTSPTLNEQSPLTYYCKRLNIDHSDAVYVYASTTVPFHKKFSRLQSEQNRVFFVKL